MTRQRHLKQLVRARMEKTGERYAAARRHVVAQSTSSGAIRETPHRPGSVPAAAALRALLSSTGIVDPRTREPFSEAMVFGIAGGIGAGVFSFYYEKPEFSSFYIAGRHLWHDDLEYLKRAAARFGLATQVWESGGARAAEKHLITALGRGPVIAWVDLAHLPHRAMPASWSGGGYHVVVVYGVSGDRAMIGDLADDPIEIELAQLAEARARITKQKHRLLALDGAPGKLDLGNAIAQGIRACQHGLVAGRTKNFTIESFDAWATQLERSTSKDSWNRMFPPGPRLWRGLTSIYDFIEHYGTGGGLCRPLMAEFLEEAGDAGPRALHALADRYAALGRRWSELADAALPDHVPDLRAAKSLLDRKAERVLSGGEGAGEIWNELDRLEHRPAGDFPISADEADTLRGRLAPLVRRVYEEERAAAEALRALD
jgi:hypothetical protein